MRRSLIAACSPRKSNICGIDSINAKAHFGYEMPNTLYYSGERWPLDDGTADVVMATETLEHVFDANDFLHEARDAA